jgi:hypothetical protein
MCGRQHYSAQQKLLASLPKVLQQQNNWLRMTWTTVKSTSGSHAESLAVVCLSKMCSEGSPHRRVIQ